MILKIDSGFPLAQLALLLSDDLLDVQRINEWRDGRVTTVKDDRFNLQNLTIQQDGCLVFLEAEGDAIPLLQLLAVVQLLRQTGMDKTPSHCYLDGAQMGPSALTDALLKASKKLIPEPA